MDSNHRNVRVKVWCLTTWLRDIKVVEGHGFEPWNPKEQIYSLPRLTTSLTLHKKMVPTPGLEPGTYWLQVSCSTNWAMSAWWAIQDSNLWPPACKAGALTNWANRPTINDYKNLNGARGRTWTGTRVESRGILSPVRLPIPPLGQHINNVLN